MTGDNGSMAVAMSGATAVVAILGVAIAAIGMLYAARAQATNAADAAALAAAVATYPSAADTDPVTAARRATQLNGAVLVGCSCPRDSSLTARTVEVLAAIEVDVPVFGVVTVRGTSRAEFDPALWLGLGTPAAPHSRPFGAALRAVPGRGGQRGGASAQSG